MISQVTLIENVCLRSDVRTNGGWLNYQCSPLTNIAGERNFWLRDFTGWQIRTDRLAEQRAIWASFAEYFISNWIFKLIPKNLNVSYWICLVKTLLLTTLVFSLLSNNLGKGALQSLKAFVRALFRSLKKCRRAR